MNIVCVSNLWTAMSANVIYNTDMNIGFVQPAHTTRRSIKKKPRRQYRCNLQNKCCTNTYLIHMWSSSPFDKRVFLYPILKSTCLAPRSTVTFKTCRQDNARLCILSKYPIYIYISRLFSCIYILKRLSTSSNEAEKIREVPKGVWYGSMSALEADTVVKLAVSLMQNLFIYYYLLLSM